MHPALMIYADQCVIRRWDWHVATRLLLALRKLPNADPVIHSGCRPSDDPWHPGRRPTASPGDGQMGRWGLGWGITRAILTRSVMILVVCGVENERSTPGSSCR